MRNPRQRGVALILVAVLSIALVMLSFVSLQLTMAQAAQRETRQLVFVAKQLADSATAQALARVKEGGQAQPHSGTGANAAWVNFWDGQFFYDTDYDAANDVTRIRAWGRIAADENPSTSTASPDSLAWDGSGWLVRGVEVTLKGSIYTPESPIFVGNGGIELPRGGFAWTGSANPKDSSTWGTVNSGPSSYQTGDIPFEVSALDHPTDYNYVGGSPAPASTNPHPYQIWASQNEIGQHNTNAWFNKSAGDGFDPTSNVTPPPTDLYYNASDLTSPDHPYAIDTSVPDVQTFSHSLWNKFGVAPDTTQLNGGSLSGTYGDLSNPGVTFVTGNLRVERDQKFEGAGVLVIRDDFDPNMDRENQPGNKAGLTISGEFKWTGLVIIAGWAPMVDIANSADVTIVGSLFGEDSVQSGGEISLDSATIIWRIRGAFRVLYSAGLFGDGGIVQPFLPRVKLEIAGIRDVSGKTYYHFMKEAGTVALAK